ncbi:MAG: hypothetical protein CMM69_09180 [Rhodospirillaceae bacterium]|nr:hypothetical protein [Rhodospirillaceae bacterium]OUX26616.1 MAG: hypothetical protein CBE16_09710 [Rhodospirillaceae bacterium TMED256]
MFRLNHKATALINSLIEKAVYWMELQRNAFRPSAFDLPQTECNFMAPFPRKRHWRKFVSVMSH